jgi:hypothetical protein
MSNFSLSYYIITLFKGKLRKKNIFLYVDSKLILFSNIFIPIFFPFYLETNLSKSIKSKITQLRISAHCLNIERGRYNKPNIPREEENQHFEFS